jgi:paraquat-inducible protein B
VNSADAQQLAQQLGETLTETRTALRDASELMTSLDEQVEPLMGDLSKAMRNLDATLVTAQSTLQSADEQLRGDTQLSYQLVDTLQAVDAAARSLSVLLDLIDRDPQVLLRGKRKQ